MKVCIQRLIYCHTYIYINRLLMLCCHSYLHMLQMYMYIFNIYIHISKLPMLPYIYTERFHIQPCIYIDYICCHTYVYIEFIYCHMHVYKVYICYIYFSGGLALPSYNNPFLMWMLKCWHFQDILKLFGSNAKYYLMPVVSQTLGSILYVNFKIKNI